MKKGNYGQEAGDSILQELAALIRSESHVVEACRMYSDYFIELVRGTDKKNILGLCEREGSDVCEQQRSAFEWSHAAFGWNLLYR